MGTLKLWIEKKNVSRNFKNMRNIENFDNVFLVINCTTLDFDNELERMII